jgi:hypothetical protein
VLDDPNKKMGHAFVLLMLLRGERLWETDDIPEYMSPIPQPPVSQSWSKRVSSVPVVQTRL